MNEKVMLCHRQGREGYEPLNALKSSKCGRMISDFRVQDLESKLMMLGTTWDEKIQIPKLDLRVVSETVR